MDRGLFEFAFFSGLLLLKKSFYPLFLTAMYLALIPLVYYTTNKRLGGCIYNFPSKTRCLFGARCQKSRKYGMSYASHVSSSYRAQMHANETLSIQRPVGPLPGLAVRLAEDARRMDRYTQDNINTHSLSFQTIQSCLICTQASSWTSSFPVYWLMKDCVHT